MCLLIIIENIKHLRTVLSQITVNEYQLTLKATFFPRLHVPILVHPVLSDVNQDFTFKVPDADVPHLPDL